MKARKSYIDKSGSARELDAQFFAEAKRGRPKLPQEERKQQVTMLLDPDVIAFFKKGGRGWQTRVNAALRELMPDVQGAMKRGSAPAKRD